MGFGGMNEDSDNNLGCEKLSFEDALLELEGIVTSLESGEVLLEDAITAFERGTELKILCQTRLEEARMKVEKIKIPDSGVVPNEVQALDAGET